MTSLVEPDAATPAEVEEAYGKLPLSFEANQGQADPEVRFISRGSDYTLFLTATEAVLALGKPGLASTGEGGDTQATTGTVLRMKLLGASQAPQITGLDELPGKNNYFIGNDPQQWRTNVPTYTKVQYRDVYPGVDLVYHGNQRQLEYDLIIAPGAEPGDITLAFQGADKIEIDPQSNLVLHVAGGEVIQHAPIIYQEVNGAKQAIPGRYVLKSTHQVGFQVAAYDASRPLIIDPVLEYSTYLGGTSGELGVGITTDADGNAYVTGQASTDFPTTAGAFQTTAGSVFVTKLNATGSALVFSTYLGVGGEGSDIAVDSDGNVYVAGYTGPNFPTTPGAFQAANAGRSDGFVTKLTPDGSGLLYSTYLGGSGSDFIEMNDLAVDAAGNAYVAGDTTSTDFPTTVGAIQPSFAGGQEDAFVTKLNSAGSGLVYSSYLGGSGVDQGWGIAVDASGNAYVTGLSSSTDFPTTVGAFQSAFGGVLDAFVTKVNSDGSALVYSTYLGGSSREEGIGIAVDAGGNAYVTGSAFSTGFPTTAGAFQPSFGGGFDDAFVTKLNPAGSGLVYSTYLGGSGSEGFFFAIAVDSVGNAYVTGATSSTDFPTANPIQATHGGASSDAFVTKVNSDGSGLVYSTYLGGSGFENGYGIAVDAFGNAYVTGRTTSTDFPTTVGAFQTTFGGPGADAFIAKIANDTDSDGIPDTLDNCPATPNGPAQAAVLGVGNQTDSDGDGVPGVQPPTNGTFGGDACDVDDDNDGIADVDDVSCRTLAEDFDGFEDADGCPDPDNDLDGICDPGQTSVSCTGSDFGKFAFFPPGHVHGDPASVDCRNVPEDIDAFKDSDGCPEPDNDNDGFPDATDACPGTDTHAGADGALGSPEDSNHNGIQDGGESALTTDDVVMTFEDYDGILDTDGCHDSPGDDFDGDGWPDEVEVFSVGTDPGDGCPDNSSDDANPADFNNDTFFTGFDLSAVAADIGQAVPPAPARKDIAPLTAPDAQITGAELSAVAARIGQTCT